MSVVDECAAGEGEYPWDSRAFDSRAAAPSAAVAGSNANIGLGLTAPPELLRAQLALGGHRRRNSEGDAPSIERVDSLQSDDAPRDGAEGEAPSSARRRERAITSEQPLAHAGAAEQAAALADAHALAARLAAMDRSDGSRELQLPPSLADGGAAASDVSLSRRGSLGPHDWCATSHPLTTEREAPK